MNKKNELKKWIKKGIKEMNANTINHYKIK